MFAVLDPTGVYETILRYSMILSLVGGAVVILLYLWWTNRLDMNEVPKEQMLTVNEDYPEKENSKAGKERQS